MKNVQPWVRVPRIIRDIPNDYIHYGNKEGHLRETIDKNVKIGQGSWIGPNSSISHGIIIGENCFVGISCNLRKSIESNIRVSGNPAKFLSNDF